jgi:hypothetical protein
MSKVSTGKHHSKLKLEPGVVGHNCIPRTREVEAGGFWVQGQPGLIVSLSPDWATCSETLLQINQSIN